MTAVSERLIREAAAINEQQIIEKIQANIRFNNNISIIKDIRKYNGTEINNNKKKLSKYKTSTNMTEITEILISSIATTEATTSVENHKSYG